MQMQMQIVQLIQKQTLTPLQYIYPPQYLNQYFRFGMQSERKKFADYNQIPNLTKLLQDNKLKSETKYSQTEALYGKPYRPQVHSFPQLQQIIHSQYYGMQFHQAFPILPNPFENHAVRQGDFDDFRIRQQLKVECPQNWMQKNRHQNEFQIELPPLFSINMSSISDEELQKGICELNNNNSSKLIIKVIAIFLYILFLNFYFRLEVLFSFKYNKHQFNITLKLIGMNQAAEKQRQMLQTHFKLEREHQDQMPYPIDRQVDTLVTNIKFYLCILMSNKAGLEEIEQIKKVLITQLDFINSDFAHTQKLPRFDSFKESVEEYSQKAYSEYVGFKKVELFGQTIKELMAFRSDTQSQQQFQNLNQIINSFLKEMETIIQQDNYTISRLQKYEIEDNNLEKSCKSNDNEVLEVPASHYWKKQRILFRKWQPRQVFDFIEPSLHQLYISEVTKAYHDCVPFKIKFVSLNSLDQPKIDTPNYFNQEIDPEKAILHYCKPGSKTLITYRIQDICKVLTISKQYAFQREISMNWTFTDQAKTVITPDGRIFGINCRTTQSKQDSSMYEITAEKVSNRGRTPEPKRNSSFIYCNKSLYIIGGNGDKQKCSTKNFKYSIRDKKWSQISNSNVGLRKATVCSFRDRYIFKIGGLNEFDYINKVIEMYDTTTDKWSIVRANAKNILQQIQILEDSLATQIGEDQIYVFAGKNSNNFSADTGFVLQVMEIRQKIKAAAKVSGQLWNVSIGKKNLLSFFGLFSQSNIVAHGNCLYALRSSTSKMN